MTNNISNQPVVKDAPLNPDGTLNNTDTNPQTKQYIINVCLSCSGQFIISATSPTEAEQKYRDLPFDDIIKNLEFGEEVFDIQES